MLDADGVVFASPVYALHVSSMTKNFIDRLGYFAHRPVFHNKFALVMVTLSGYGGKYAYSYMSDMFSAFGFNVVTNIELKVRPGKRYDNYKSTHDENLFKAVDALIDRIRKGIKNPPSLGLLVPFTLFKTVSNLDKEKMSADYEYYKNKNDYYYDTKIPFFKKMIAKNVVKKILSDIK